MYRYADTGAIVSLFSRLAIEKSLTHKRIVKALREYRNLYAVQHRLAGRMIYPESLKLLPLYGLSLSKSTALLGGFSDASLDERSAAGYTIMTLPVKKLLQLLYPNSIRLDERLTKIRIRRQIKKRRKEVAFDSRELLGQDCAVDLSRVNFCQRDQEMSRKLFTLLDKIRESDPSSYQLCNLVRPGGQPREGLLLLTNLVEDQVAGTNGYVDWLVQTQRQVQQNA